MPLSTEGRKSKYIQLKIKKEMRKISQPGKFILFSVACLIAVIGGTELLNYYTKAYYLYYTHMWHRMLLRIAFPVILGILAFFRQHARQQMFLPWYVYVDGAAAMFMLVYLVIQWNLYTKGDRVVFSSETLLYLSLFVHLSIALSAEAKKK